MANQGKYRATMTKLGVSYQEQFPEEFKKIAGEIVAIKHGKHVEDITTLVDEKREVELITFASKEGKQVFWHSAAHVLAIALMRLYPEAKLTIGPPIENGFYYDIAYKDTFSNEDLAKIEKEIEKVIKENIPFEREVISYEKAKELFKDNIFKLEIIEEYKDQELTIYKNGDFYDLCTGPHVKATGVIGAVKLLRASGAYWRGDETKQQLQRIYGIAFPSRKELRTYLHERAEALKRDHVVLGKKLGLFIQSDIIGQGLPLFTAKGSKIVQLLQRWVEDEEEKRGYELTMTPFMAKSDLYKISGHWDHYKENMFLVNGCGDEMALRPMTCPFQFQIYLAEKRSYRDLPIRYNETSKLFRNEDSGAMHGLIRVRQFTISEGHIICRLDQVEKEFLDALNLINYIFKTLGLEGLSYEFAKHDPNNKKKYIDNPGAWQKTETMLKNILEKTGLDYEEVEGEAAFYGPKLDIQMKNVHGKQDTIMTIQIDFAMPERYNMTYVDEHGEEALPIIIHRTSIGCYERTLAMLIEHYAGKFPLWLNPEQVRVLAITDSHKAYAEKVCEQLKEKGIRATVDSRSLTINKKVREAQMEYVNYIVVVGDKEEENGTVNIRTRDNVVHGEKEVNVFISELQQAINTKSLK